MGARVRHRAPTALDPGVQLVAGAVLLAVTSGLLFAGLWEARTSCDTTWSAVFGMLLLADVAGYFWAVSAILAWWRGSTHEGQHRR